VVYRNAWIEVYHDEVVRPDGRPGVYGVVHPTFVATGVVAIDAADRAVLVGQHRYTLNVYSWEIPAGGVPFDESVLDGARRELAEETGYVAVRWRELLHFSLLNSLTDERGVVFLATELTEDVAEPDGTEDITVRLVPFDEAVEMVMSGEIHDAVSQLGLLAAARTLGR
jgi:8-oxo-dGTP pyrophosphatase MutT (NUDIX family)